MPKPIKILHLEDDPLDAELIYTTLVSADSPYNITWVQTSHDFKKALVDGDFELVLADFKLPSYDGISAMHYVKEHYPEIPFIFISGTMGEDAAIQALTQGATDYVLKQKLARLVPAVSRALLDSKNRKERKKAEEETKKAYTLLNETQNIARLGGWEYEKSTCQCTWTDEVYRIYGVDHDFNPSDINCAIKFYFPKDQQVIDQAFWRAVEYGEPYNLELGFIRADGSHIWVRTMGKPVIEQGKVVRVTGNIMDVTERRQAEEDIRKLNQELEQRVAERTAQLEAANKELEAFAYSVSHDLRSPLRTIRGFIELLQERTNTMLDEQSQQYMLNIATSAKNLNTLIEDILSFSRMGRAEMSHQHIDLASLVQEVIHDLEPESAGRSIHWQVASLPVATGDRALIKMVLVNLLSNALKFTRPRSQAEIEIGCISETENETVFFVRDNGVGFDMGQVDKLFGVFKRLHRNDEFEGTGIGLANVRRIISRHGGRTWAVGEVEHGATFYFSLPRSSQAE
jgi:signal transduction histidine kinase/DNA-binding response OmpR family regulator